MKIQYFPSQGFVHWILFFKFRNFNISENNIISVQAAKVLWNFIEMLEVWISEGQKAFIGGKEFFEFIIFFEPLTSSFWMGGHSRPQKNL